MKKNKMMRLASLLLVAVLLTTSVIGGTFAKYTSTASANDDARVAYWGFGQDTAMIDVEHLFMPTYEKEDDSFVLAAAEDGDTGIIAPGTAGDATFEFNYVGNTNAGVTAPEVAYTFDVEVVAAETNCNQLIQDNQNIQWKLDNGAWGTWSDLLDAIDALGEGTNNGKYEPGQLPVGFTTNGAHTIAWQWIFEDATVDTDKYTVDGVEMNQDEYDTYMGNQAELAEVSIGIKITATQVNE